MLIERFYQELSGSKYSLVRYYDGEFVVGGNSIRGEVRSDEEGGRRRKEEEDERGGGRRRRREEGG